MVACESVPRLRTSPRVRLSVNVGRVLLWRERPVLGGDNIAFFDMLFLQSVCGRGQRREEGGGGVEGRGEAGVNRSFVFVPENVAGEGAVLVSLR